MTDLPKLENSYRVGTSEVLKDLVISSCFLIMSNANLLENLELRMLLRLTLLKTGKFAAHPRALAAPAFPLANCRAMEGALEFLFFTNPYLKRRLFGSKFLPAASSALCTIGKLPVATPLPGAKYGLARTEYLDELYKGGVAEDTPTGPPRSWA